VSSDDPQALVIIQSDKSKGKMADKTNMKIDIGSNRIQLEPSEVRIKIGPGLGAIKSEFTVDMLPSIYSVE